MIGLITTWVFLANLLGGLLSNIILAYAGPITERKLTERMGFKMCMASELMLVIYAFYYHAVLIQTVVLTHVVYWFLSMWMIPLLAVFGAQITHLIFTKEIQANKKAQRKIDMKAAKVAAKRAAAKLAGAKRAAPGVAKPAAPGVAGPVAPGATEDARSLRIDRKQDK